MALENTPLTLIRGALSDLLTVETAATMQARLPQMEMVTIPHVGHAPTLEEPAAVAAIDRLLDRVMARA